MAENPIGKFKPPASQVVVGSKGLIPWGDQPLNPEPLNPEPLNPEPGLSLYQLNYHQTGIQAFDEQIDSVRLIRLVDQGLEIFH